uniref:Uncharacterized protein n=1 Tax=Rhizophora mucronata TaxID=61149 RepID=A0A2P2P8V2_RHIMU
MQSAFSTLPTSKEHFAQRCNRGLLLSSLSVTQTEKLHFADN